MRDKATRGRAADGPLFRLIGNSGRGQGRLRDRRIRDDRVPGPRTAGVGVKTSWRERELAGLDRDGVMVGPLGVERVVGQGAQLEEAAVEGGLVPAARRRAGEPAAVDSGSSAAPSREAGPRLGGNRRSCRTQPSPRVPLLPSQTGSKSAGLRPSCRWAITCL